MKPTAVTVLGQPFTIEYVTVDKNDLANDGHAMGRTTVRNLRIVVDVDQHERQLQDTVLHEVLHACTHVQELGADDEATVARLAPVLLDVLRSNPVLVQWLTA